jgi:hypothetical protein
MENQDAEHNAQRKDEAEKPNRYNKERTKED